MVNTNANPGRTRTAVIAWSLSAAVGLGAGGTAAQEEPILAHSVFGSGPEHVLVLHDWMGNAQNYQGMIQHLDGSTFTYVFADVRGYGASRDLTGAYTASEVASDAFRLADELGWDRFFVIGHSMTGMVVQRMAIDDWVSGERRLRGVVGLTPVPASGVPLDQGTSDFVTAVVHNAELTVQYAAVVTAGHASMAFAAEMARRQIEENDADAMHGYRLMWTVGDFSAEAAAAQVETPMRVIGGRLDGPAFTEESYAQTIALWFPNAEFRYIADAAHYVMVEAPLYTAFLIEEFLRAHL